MQKQSLVKNDSFLKNALLTVSGVKSITPLTDEGGGAAGDEVLRS
ncbi:hypothetical protein [Rhizobium sp. SL42]|nr:hypothetical protein [Rhizobium sp. SL42]